ncbi:hypothetical protein BC835DRAFT_1419055 [Cytidiella melzeri]|nr:hypothetical protein BC835DRAFT_1419055 [Cytidiella melzeri]
MSQKWVYSALEKLSEVAHNSMLRDIVLYPWFGGHDNLNLAFKVYEQRIANQSHFDSGTAATVYIIKHPNVTAPSRLAYQKQRALGVQRPINSADIILMDAKATLSNRQFEIHTILRFLIDSPAFDRSTWPHNESPALLGPQPVTQLPTGDAHVLCQYMLDTVHIEEASQDGNRQCLEEWMKQTGISGDRARQEPARDRLVVWVGDQLTTVRIRALKKDRSLDDSFVQRFEQFLEMFGWFHAQIAEEHSIHRQYHTTSKAFGLKSAFETLKRKGLNSPSVQGNFHHTMQEALRHTAEARFRDLWLVVGRVKDLTQLRRRTPQQLINLAAKIHDSYATTQALSEMKQKPREDQDDVLYQSIQFCRDILNYISLDDAIKMGDVGRLENLIPRLFFRFNGGTSSNYAIELLELLQGMLREWPAELRAFMTRYCWLANTSGRPGCFLAFDMVQEHNIRDIKHIFAVHGPFSSWEYIKKISASIPTQRKIKDHVEENFNHFRRGKSHTTPEYEKDVVALQKVYHEGDAHVYTAGRHLESKLPDYVLMGSEATRIDTTILRWWQKRVLEKSIRDE